MRSVLLMVEMCTRWMGLDMREWMGHRQQIGVGKHEVSAQARLLPRSQWAWRHTAVSLLPPSNGIPC